MPVSILSLLYIWLKHKPFCFIFMWLKGMTDQIVKMSFFKSQYFENTFLKRSTFTNILNKQ